MNLYEKGWFRTLCFIFCFFFNTVLISVLGMELIPYVFGLEEKLSFSMMDSNPYMLTFMQILSLLGNGLLVYLFRRFVDKKDMASLGMTWRSWEKDAFFGFALGTLLITAGFVILLGMGLLQVVSIGGSLSLILLYLFLFLVVGIHEELVVRGYILNNLLESFPAWVAVLLSSLFFGFIHSMNDHVTYVAMLNIVLAGLLFGTYYYYRRNLWFPIMLHFSWNFFQGAVWGFEVSGLDMVSIVQQKLEGSDYWTGGDFGFEGSALLTVILTVCIGGMVLFYERKRQVESRSLS